METIGPRPSVRSENDKHREGVQGGRFGWGIGSAIKISCPSYLGCTDFTHGRVHGPSSLLDPESHSPYGTCEPCQH